MIVLFITTSTNDVDSLVNAWNSFNTTPAERIFFNHKGVIDNALILSRAQDIAPELIFYVGYFNYGPAIQTLCALRKLAPMIHLCCDAGDGHYWVPMLNRYKEAKCFDLQVNLDGCHVDSSL